MSDKLDALFAQAWAARDEAMRRQRMTFHYEYGAFTKCSSCGAPEPLAGGRTSCRHCMASADRTISTGYSWTNS